MEAAMAASMPETQTAGRSPRRGRRLLITLAAAGLAAAYLLAVGSSHLALIGGQVGWSGSVAGHGTGLRPMTQAETDLVESPDAYSSRRVVCDPIIRDDALHYGAGASVLGDATSPVVVRCRVLGFGLTQTLTLGTPRAGEYVLRRVRLTTQPVPTAAR
jgi:hypothetical protein